MDSKAALHFVDWLFAEKNCPCLDSKHAYVFKGIWEGKTYREMAEGYEVGTIKNYGYALCKRIKKELNIDVNKSSLRAKVKQLHLSREKKSKDVYFPQDKKSPDQSTFTSSSSKEIRKDDYKHADALLEAAGEVSSRKEMRLALTALEIYKQHNDGEIISALLCRSQQLNKNKQDTLGKKAYRLGFAFRTSSLINWLIESYQIEDLISQSDIAKLCNIGGDSTWMTGNDNKRAIFLHEKALEAACNDDSVNGLVIDSVINKALCYLDNKELEDAEICLRKAFFAVKDLATSEYSRRSLIVVWSLLAYLHALQGKTEAEDIIQLAYCALSDRKDFELLNNWERHNLPIYVGKALQTVKRYPDAFQMYMQARRIAIPNEYVQVEAKSLMNTAYLNWVAGQISCSFRAVRSIRKAYWIFRAIGAKGDAEQAQIFLEIISRTTGQAEKNHFLLHI